MGKMIYAYFYFYADTYCIYYVYCILCNIWVYKVHCIHINIDSVCMYL